MDDHIGLPFVSIASGQRNLMKTYHNEVNTGGITKIAMRFFWGISDKVDRLTKLQNSDFQSHFSTSKIVRIFLFFFIEEYQLRKPTFVKNIF